MRAKSQNFDPRQHMQSDTFEIFHYREPKSYEVQVHHHDFYEVYCLLNGDVDYWVDGKIYHMQSGDLLLINPMELHRPIIKSKDSIYERIVLWINIDYIESLTDENFSFTRCFDNSIPTHTNHLKLSSVKRTEIISKLSELIKEVYSDEMGNRVCATGLFYQLMVELNRISADNTETKPIKNETSSLVTNVIRYISDNYSESISLDELASRFYVSKYHLSHEFSENVGTSVYKYLMLKRLLVAKQLLMSGVAPGEVYLHCGFKDYTAFFKAFKEEYGVSPRNYQMKS